MASKDPQMLDYGNWVSTRFVVVPAALGIVLVLLSLLSPFVLIPAAVFFLIGGYFLYARQVFSSRGANLQERIRSLVLQALPWDGKGNALDIGCGSAGLTIQLARKFPQSNVVGTDYWGGIWQYSQTVCQSNAQVEGVDQRVSFQKASAAALPFDDEAFDVVVSNLVFHEVKDAPNKIDLIREALRVLKKGGKFALQDLFYIQRYYGSPEALIQAIHGLGVTKVELVATKNDPLIPGALKLPFMLGTLGLVYGEK